MAYFLRFTNTAQHDLDRGTSIHASDLSINDFSTKQAAEIFGCDIDSVGEFNGCYCQILDGICGYLLQSENLDEVIDEIKEKKYQFEFVGNPVIFTGKYSNDSDLVPDGDLFIPTSIVLEL